MAEQLTIDGKLVPYPLPTPRRLTERQRDLLRFVWTHDDTITTRDVGRFYADPHGAMCRLEALYLVRRDGRGKWRAT